MPPGRVSSGLPTDPAGSPKVCCRAGRCPPAADAASEVMIPPPVLWLMSPRDSSHPEGCAQQPNPGPEPPQATARPAEPKTPRKHQHTGTSTTYHRRSVDVPQHAHAFNTHRDLFKHSKRAEIAVIIPSGLANAHLPQVSLCMEGTALARLEFSSAVELHHVSARDVTLLPRAHLRLSSGNDKSEGLCSEGGASCQ